MALSRSDLLSNVAAAVHKTPLEELHLSELHGSVWVRGCTAGERFRIVDKAKFTRGPRRGDLDTQVFQGAMLLACLVNEDGTPILQQGDVPALNGLPAGVIDRVMGVINRLSGFTDEVEEALGNDSASPAATGGSSSN